MRNLFILLGILFPTLVSSGQEEYTYLPTLEPGKKWTLQTVFPDWSTFEPFYTEVTVLRDTTIGEDPAFILKVERLIANSSTHYGIVPITYPILREKDRQIHRYYDDSILYSPVIDFDCHAGERTTDIRFLELTPRWLTGPLVIEEGYMVINEIERRFLKLENGHYFIEGIGSPTTYSLTTGAEPGVWAQVKTNIISCEKNGGLLFNTDDYYRLSRVKDTCYSSDKNNIVYDCSGLIIEQPIPGRVYIKNGKKFYIVP